MEELTGEEVKAALREEVTRITATCTSREHIRLLTVLAEPYTPENGCLVCLRAVAPARPAPLPRRLTSPPPSTMHRGLRVQTLCEPALFTARLQT